MTSYGPLVKGLLTSLELGAPVGAIVGSHHDIHAQDPELCNDPLLCSLICFGPPLTGLVSAWQPESTHFVSAIEERSCLDYTLTHTRIEVALQDGCMQRICSSQCV